MKEIIKEQEIHEDDIRPKRYHIPHNPSMNDLENNIKEDVKKRRILFGAATVCSLHLQDPLSPSQNDITNKLQQAFKRLSKKFAPDWSDESFIKSPLSYYVRGIQIFSYSLSEASKTGSVFCVDLTKRMDQFIEEIFKDAGAPSEVTVCAVGGYGRKELCPGSDIDVLLIHDELFDISEEALVIVIILSLGIVTILSFV